VEAPREDRESRGRVGPTLVLHPELHVSARACMCQHRRPL